MRHRRMLAPINSIKHYVHRTNLSRTSGQALNEIVVSAVTVAAEGAASNEVTEGSIVKAVHMDYWVLSDGATGTSTQFTAILEKVTNVLPGASAAELVNLGAYNNKKNILYSFQGNLGAAVDGQGTLPFIRDWFKIPRGKQRMGFGDRIILSLVSTGQTIEVCGLSTYKEYQ